MEKFENYLKKTGEVGYVEEIIHSLVYVSGLPSARIGEIVLFESGELGQAISLLEDHVEVLLFNKDHVAVGSKVARTDGFLEVPVGGELLGKVISPLGVVLDGDGILPGSYRRIDVNPPGILARVPVTEALETGVALVDMIVPMGKGQRELVMGDRKTGKTGFLVQTILAQASKGTVCVYAAVAKKAVEVTRTIEVFKAKGVDKSTVVISTTSSDAPGLIYLAPYTAMTVAEYFRDQGRDVLIIFDDLTAHAKYYREISLLARRFPGRSSYPGDIFYIHAKLLERAGKFPKGSISALPVAETILGDFSGYIQTNLMAMTDGHIFFDSDLYNQGRRPAINPFLSVTRVGHQAQSPLLKDLSRQLSSFLVELEKLREFMHFGAELSEAIRRKLALGDRILLFFGQSSDSTTMPVNVSTILLAYLWAGMWSQHDGPIMIEAMKKFNGKYLADPAFRKQIDALVAASVKFDDLVNAVRDKGALLN